MLQLQHGQVLQDALLHLLQSVVVLVQRLFGVLQVEVVRRIDAPWQAQHRLQVVQLHAVVGRLRVRALQLVHLLQEDGLHLVAPFHRLRLLAHFGYLLFLRASAQLVLNGLDLLLQEVFALLLVDVLAGPHLDGSLDFGQLHLAVQYLQQVVGAVAHGGQPQQFHLLVLLELQVGADEVDQEDGVAYVLDGKRGVLREHLRRTHVAHDEVLACLHQCLEFLVVLVGQLLVEGRHVSLQVGRGLHDFLQLHALGALQDGGCGLVGHFEHTYHLGHGTHVVQVLGQRRLRVGHLLAHHADVHSLALGVLDEPQRRLPPYGYRHQHARKQHHVAKGQYGQHVVYLHVHQLLFVASFVVGNDGEASSGLRFVIAHIKSFLHFCHVKLVLSCGSSQSRCKFTLFLCINRPPIL